MVRTFSLVVLGTIAALIVGCGKAKNNAAVEESVVGNNTSFVVATAAVAAVPAVAAKPAVPAIPAIPFLGIKATKAVPAVAAKAAVPAKPATFVPGQSVCVDVSISPKLTPAQLAAAKTQNEARLRLAPGAGAVLRNGPCAIVPATKFVCVHTTADKKGYTTKTRRVYPAATTQVEATKDCVIAKGVLQARTK